MDDSLNTPPMIGRSDSGKKYNKVICYKCKSDTGYTEELIVKGNVKEDLKCPHCGAVVITKQIDYC